jgi:hypothetical protein
MPPIGSVSLAPPRFSRECSRRELALPSVQRKAPSAGERAGLVFWKMAALRAQPSRSYHRVVARNRSQILVRWGVSALTPGTRNPE